MKQLLKITITTIALSLALFSCSSKDELINEFGFENIAHIIHNKFEGQIADQQSGKTIYLSIIEDYRKFGRISMEQILKKTTTDSLGYFKFTGDNLFDENRVYRIEHSINK